MEEMNFEPATLSSGWHASSKVKYSWHPVAVMASNPRAGAAQNLVFIEPASNDGVWFCPAAVA